MAYVEIDDHEDVDRAIRRFKRFVEREGIIREWKKREYYEKPSAIRNRKKKSLRNKNRRKVR